MPASWMRSAIRTVSYTHLDVYKRQLIGRILALAEHVGDLFALGQLQQVDDVGALALSLIHIF